MRERTGFAKFLIILAVHFLGCNIIDKVLLIIYSTQFMWFAGLMLEIKPQMPPKPIDAPSLIQNGLPATINTKVDMCWSKHEMVEYIVDYLMRVAALNGFVADYQLRKIQTYLRACVKYEISPLLKASLGNPNADFIEENHRDGRNQKLKGLLSADPADPSYEKLNEVVACVFAETPHVKMGAGGQRLGPFMKRRTKSLQVLLRALIQKMIDFNRILT